MAGRIFLHVGTMKSATSYLQKLCQRNQGALRDAGVLWPGAQRNFQAVDDLLGRRREELKGSDAWKNLSAEIQGFDGDVLVSNELLIHRPDADIRTLVNALAPAEVHVVITARDLARVVPSQWQTHLRGGRGTASWADYSASVCREPSDTIGENFWRRQDIPAAIARWRRRVPLDRMTLVTIPPSGSDPVLAGDRFLSVLGRDIGTLQQPAYRNDSLGAHSAELVRRLNGETKDWNWPSYRRAFKVVLSSRILEKRASLEPKVRLTDQQFDVIAARAKAMVSELEALDLAVVGDLTDLLPVPRTAPGAGDQVQSTPEDVLSAACYGLVEMARELSEQSPGRRGGRR